MPVPRGRRGGAQSEAAGPDWKAVRGGYPGARGRAYLDTACKGLPSPAAEQALLSHIRGLRESPSRSATDDTIEMTRQFARARSAVAALLAVEPETVALVPSTEAGLAAVASGLPLESGDRILASDLEFVGTVLPWRFLARSGVELDFVPHRQGRIEPADLEAAMDGHTRAVVVSSVQEVNGFRVDLEALSRVCRSRGALLIVDAVQHLGPLLLDPVGSGLDAVAVGGHKWLCAPFGMGFLYVSPQLSERLEPPSQAFMTASPARGDWRSYLEDPSRHPADPLRFPSGAARLELAGLGTSLAAAGLAAAAETLLELGPAAVAARSAELAALTTSALEEAGAEIVTPSSREPSSIVTFRSGLEAAAEQELLERLAAAGVLASLRFTTGVGGIRLSPYFYNDEADIERTAALVRAEIRRRARARRASPSLPGEGRGLEAH